RQLYSLSLHDALPIYITATDWIWSNEDTVKRWDRTEFFVECTLDFVRRNKDAPCFVNLWLDDPHTPWTPNANASEQPATESRERDRKSTRLNSSHVKI